MTTKRSVPLSLIALIIITLITYAPVLFNGFVGDDEVLFLKNDFYHSIGNIKTIFSKQYIADLSQYYGSKDGRYYGTGEWSYRPVRTASYFIDAYLYKFNPFGYHLTNLLLHTGAVAFLYLSLCFLFASAVPAFLVAAIFSLHPLQLETVAGLSYRTDALAALFTFGSLYFYLRQETDSRKEPGIKFMLLSILFYALGVFSKESVIVYPVIIFFLGILMFRLKPGEAFNRAAGFAFIAVIYLALYFFVFKNSFIGHVPFGQEPWLTRLAACGLILLHYLTWFIVPQSVHLLPGLYTPPVDTLSAAAYLPAVVFLLICVLLITDGERRRTTIFFLIWFVLAYIPVSNIIPLANPCAHRFMYFPSVGIYAVLALLFDKVCSSERLKAVLPNAFVLVTVLLAVFLMTYTLPMTFYWRSNLSIATQWVKYYPNFFKGYEILALENHKHLECDEVIKNADRALLMNKTPDPRMYYVKGSCLAAGHPQKEELLLKAVELQPNFMAAHFELGKLYYAGMSFDRALLSFETAYALSPEFNTSLYLIKTYLAMKQMTTAERLYVDLYERTPGKWQKRYLENFYLKNFSVFTPLNAAGGK